LPCRKDFDSRNYLDSFLAKHKIVPVFISIDNPKVREVWKNFIYKHQLNGYHLLAGQELMKDLKQKAYKNGAIDIPRYIIIKKGKIIEANAFRPGDGQKLLEQLTKKLF